jgi:hypothetical protein
MRNFKGPIEMLERDHYFFDVQQNRVLCRFFKD